MDLCITPLNRLEPKEKKERLLRSAEPDWASALLDAMALACPSMRTQSSLHCSPSAKISSWGGWGESGVEVWGELGVC